MVKYSKILEKKSELHDPSKDPIIHECWLHMKKAYKESGLFDKPVNSTWLEHQKGIDKEEEEFRSLIRQTPCSHTRDNKKVAQTILLHDFQLACTMYF